MPLPAQVQKLLTLYPINSRDSAASAPILFEGPSWQGNYGMSLRDKGVNTDDRVRVIIPLTQYSNDGRSFVKARDFDPSSSSQFTVKRGDRILNFFSTERYAKATDIEKALGLDEVFTVTEVTVNDFGSPHMQHIVIIAR